MLSHLFMHFLPVNYTEDNSFTAYRIGYQRARAFLWLFWITLKLFWSWQMYCNLHAIAEMIIIPLQQFLWCASLTVIFNTFVILFVVISGERCQIASLKQNVTDPNKHLLTLSVPWVMLLMSIERTWSLQPTYILSWSSSMCRIL